MKEITIVGTGYVGLTTGLCLAEIGHTITCYDVDQSKIEQLNKGFSPIFEPGVKELLEKNLDRGSISFTSDPQKAYKQATVIMLTVGTPQLKDGSPDLSQIKKAIEEIGFLVKIPFLLITKSTVPVGTNRMIADLLKEKVKELPFEVVSNPEFLREGNAVKDTFEAERIVLGTESDKAKEILEDVFKPFGRPIVHTSLEDAEMIKYASNAFLATKISFINEIANICEKVGANIDNVSYAMGLDSRIGPQFLNAGIGYGGTCFPKDTNALVQIADHVDLDFELLKAVINVNNHQHQLLFERVMKRFGSLAGKRIAVLGLAFKPNTDDIREAPAITLIQKLKDAGAIVSAYDPAAIENARRVIPDISYAKNVYSTIVDTDAVLIATEWEEFKRFSPNDFIKYMKIPIIFDGRNLFDLNDLMGFNLEYYSIGRPAIINKASQ